MINQSLVKAGFGAKKGDIVELWWIDAEHHSRLTEKELRELKDAVPTRTYGLVWDINSEYIVLVQEYSPDNTDSYWVTRIPVGTIVEYRVLRRVDEGNVE